MSDERHETIDDIVKEIRGNAEHNHALVEVSKYLTEIADRIEAAHKREREAGAEAAQIREMFDSKINEIESMKDATLDGCFEHQEQNANKLCAKLDFYEFAKRILAAMR